MNPLYIKDRVERWRERLMIEIPTAEEYKEDAVKLTLGEASTLLSDLVLFADHLYEQDSAALTITADTPRWKPFIAVEEKNDGK